MENRSDDPTRDGGTEKNEEKASRLDSVRIELTPRGEQYAKIIKIIQPELKEFIDKLSSTTD